MVVVLEYDPGTIVGILVVLEEVASVFLEVVKVIGEVSGVFVLVNRGWSLKRFCGSIGEVLEDLGDVLKEVNPVNK